jgi:pimeloyl-ACP methyl ester carboxylesterase
VAETVEIVAGGKKLEAAWFGERARRAIVLLHEGLGCVSAWRDFPARVAETSGWSVLAYSRAGYGASEPVDVPRPLSYMHDEARVLSEVLDAAAIEETVLAGHSDGGSIALIHAGRDDARSRVKALVLFAPHVFVEDVSVESIAKAKDAYAHGDLRARLEKHHGKNVDCAFWGWNRAWLDPEFRKWNIEEYVPHVRAPVTVVQGEADSYGTVAQVDAIERGLARGHAPPFTRVMLAGCGHAPHRERPEETLAAVAAASKMR